MAKVTRQVIHIDEQLCDGCGQCVPSCAEGAIQIIDGKAKLVADKYCDGLGACLGECPTGALSFEEREAEEYDENAVAQHLVAEGRTPLPSHHMQIPVSKSYHAPSGCPSSRTQQIQPLRSSTSDPSAPNQPSELRQWPIKLYLVNPSAPYFKDADILLAADCAAFAYGSLHSDFIRDKAILIGCPKFDDFQVYVQKLTSIITQNNLKSITVLHMEVPCCFGLISVAKQAIADSGRDVPLVEKVVKLDGTIESPGA